MPNRPTIREWQHRWNALVRLAEARGIRRDDQGVAIRLRTNWRVANEVAGADVIRLATYLRNERGMPIDLDNLPSTPVENLTTPIASVNTILEQPQTPTPIVRRSRRTFRNTATPRPTTVAEPPRVNPLTGRAIPAHVDSEAPTFGIEIEFMTAVGISRIVAALREAGITCNQEMYNHQVRPTWKIVTDGSLTPNPGTSAWEVVSPVLSGEQGLRDIETVCRVLTLHGGRVNRTCGFHVHVGVSRANDRPDFFKNLVRLYRQNNGTIESFLSPSRRGGNNTYCRDMNASETILNRANTVTEVIQSVTNGSRYWKLNLQSYFRHRTVEFRQHQGTIDARKAAMWVRFCLKMVAAAAKESLFAATDVSSFLAGIEADESEREYFNERHAHFEALANNGDL